MFAFTLTVASKAVSVDEAPLPLTLRLDVITAYSSPAKRSDTANGAVETLVVTQGKTGERFVGCSRKLYGPAHFSSWSWNTPGSARERTCVAARVLSVRSALFRTIAERQRVNTRSPHLPLLPSLARPILLPLARTAQYECSTPELRPHLLCARGWSPFLNSATRIYRPRRLE